MRAATGNGGFLAASVRPLLGVFGVAASLWAVPTLSSLQPNEVLDAEGCTAEQDFTLIFLATDTDKSFQCPGNWTLDPSLTDAYQENGSKQDLDSIFYGATVKNSKNVYTLTLPESPDREMKTWYYLCKAPSNNEDSLESDTVKPEVSPGLDNTHDKNLDRNEAVGNGNHGGSGGDSSGHEGKDGNNNDSLIGHPDNGSRPEPPPGSEPGVGGAGVPGAGGKPVEPGSSKEQGPAKNPNSLLPEGAASGDHALDASGPNGPNPDNKGDSLDENLEGPQASDGDVGDLQAAGQGKGEDSSSSHVTVDKDDTGKQQEVNHGVVGDPEARSPLFLARGRASPAEAPQAQRKQCRITIQVVPSSLIECNAGETKTASVSAAGRSLTIRCGEGLKWEPAALDQVFDDADGKCASQVPLNTLVHGSVSAKSDSPGAETTPSDHTLKIDELPTTPRALCYKCIDASQGEAVDPATATPKECVTRITIASVAHAATSVAAPITLFTVVGTYIGSY
ncbi:hypothetical protein BESB_082020 [Besnoitia besnoiti]|uniref:SRS domain-containing protein n=1 Tax=Besnoitia besnoiti TaxID=94643 RepID=A0A2A9MBF0_BESBE|nr:hypothetical protein BESB_082020 [Besnoitia besnoiti]PFH33003.1 hypothetical protein BESB_082020 [Besnoitia besnoiti]